MSTETNQEAVVAPEANKEEGAKESNFDLDTLRKDFAKANETIGSLKRELKDLRKSSEDRETPPKETKPDSSALLQKSFLRAAGITASEEVELALATAKKWGVEVDALVDDEDFKVKLDKLRTAKANEAATSNVKGGKGESQAKFTPEYWIAKGAPPTASEVPSRKDRAAIARAMMANAKNQGGKFYNE